MALGGKDDYPANCELLHYLLMLAFDFTLCPSFYDFSDDSSHQPANAYCSMNCK